MGGGSSKQEEARAFIFQSGGTIEWNRLLTSDVMEHSGRRAPSNKSTPVDTAATPSSRKLEISGFQQRLRMAESQTPSEKGVKANSARHESIPNPDAISSSSLTPRRAVKSDVGPDLWSLDSSLAPPSEAKDPPMLARSAKDSEKSNDEVIDISSSKDLIGGELHVESLVD